MERNKKTDAAMPNHLSVTKAYRELARGVLQHKIDREQKRLEALEILMKVIPWNLLSKNDEEILWNHFCGG